MDYEKLDKEFTRVLNSFTKKEIVEWIIESNILDEETRKDIVVFIKNSNNPKRILSNKMKRIIKNIDININ